MSAHRQKKRKPIDALEQAIETALAPGGFISYRTAWSFVNDLKKVANGVDEVTKNERAIRGLGWRANPFAAIHRMISLVSSSSRTIPTASK